MATTLDFDFILRANREISGESNQKEMDEQSRVRLREDIFGVAPKCRVIIAESSAGEAVGMALYSTTYFANEGQIMWVSQIYVAPAHRRHIATGLLMRRLRAVAVENGWPYICSGIDNDNLVSRNTVVKAGGELLEQFRIFSVKV